MPRCFMAKKLKYPYEQWKEQQQEVRRHSSSTTSSSPSSRSPSPIKQEPMDCQDVDIKLSSAFAPPPPPTAHLLAAHFGHYGFLAAAHAAAAQAAAAQAAQVASPMPAHRGSSSLTPPPESRGSKKDIFRPYCLEDPPQHHYSSNSSPFYPYLQCRNIEDINTAHAILDLSRHSTRSASPQPQQHLKKEGSLVTLSSPSPSPMLSPALSSSSAESQNCSRGGNAKTTAYTYEAFFASDGRSKKRTASTTTTTTVAEEAEVPEQVSNSKSRYSCTECGKNYATSSNLSRHKQTHRSLDSNNAKKCHICHKMYVSMPALSMHILTHNLNHRCDVCGKAFSRPWLLQGHMRSHSGDKPYGCAHCGKSFADRSNLRAHMQTHSAFKNFKCKRCNKSFALKSYLNKHYESACFKDQPIPSIETPPVTPAPSELSDDLASPGGGSDSSSQYSPASSTTSSTSSITSLLSVLPPSSAGKRQQQQQQHQQQHLLQQVRQQ